MTDDTTGETQTPTETLEEAAIARLTYLGDRAFGQMKSLIEVEGHNMGEVLQAFLGTCARVAAQNGVGSWFYSQLLGLIGHFNELHPDLVNQAAADLLEKPEQHSGNDGKAIDVVGGETEHV